MKPIPALRLKEGLTRIIQHPCCVPYRVSVDEGHRAQEFMIYAHRIEHGPKGIVAFGKKNQWNWPSPGPRVKYVRWVTGYKDRGVQVTFEQK